jgi:hypothetical protein
MDLSAIRNMTYLRLATDAGAVFQDTEIDSFISAEYDHLISVINEKNDEFFAKQVLFNSSGDESYAFPTDFLKLIKLEYNVSTRWEPIPYISPHQRTQYDSPHLWRTYREPRLRYYIIGDNYYIVPAPPAGTNNLRMIYCYVPTALSDDDDVPDFPSPYHELLVIGAVNRARMTLKEPPIEASSYDAKLVNLLETITPRVKHNPIQVRMVTGGLY